MERGKSMFGKRNYRLCNSKNLSDCAAAGKLKSMLRLPDIEHDLATETSQESQEHILHSAASILRHDIQSFVVNNEDYPANPKWKGVKVCLESETIDSVIPRIFLIVSIGTVYSSMKKYLGFFSKHLKKRKFSVEKVLKYSIKFRIWCIAE
jgi:hypothetical protein